jgi:hypothetical protein
MGTFVEVTGVLFVIITNLVTVSNEIRIGSSVLAGTSREEVR